MAPKASTLLTILLSSLAIIAQVAMASDPELLSDYTLPTNTSANAKYFTFIGARSLVNAPPPPTFNAILADIHTFPALVGQGISVAVFQFPAGGINPLHSHPRGTEVFVLVSGNLQVGFVDTKNTHFNQTLQAGDMFVYPKGLAHYQFNFDAKNPAVAISVYGSANAGTVTIPTSLFSTGIDEAILAKSFNVDVPTVEKLKTGLAKKSQQDSF